MDACRGGALSLRHGAVHYPAKSLGPLLSTDKAGVQPKAQNEYNKTRLDNLGGGSQAGNAVPQLEFY